MLVDLSVMCGRLKSHQTNLELVDRYDEILRFLIHVVRDPSGSTRAEQLFKVFWCFHFGDGSRLSPCCKVGWKVDRNCRRRHCGRITVLGTLQSSLRN